MWGEGGEGLKRFSTQGILTLESGNYSKVRQFSAFQCSFSGGFSVHSGTVPSVFWNGCGLHSPYPMVAQQQ